MNTPFWNPLGIDWSEKPRSIPDVEDEEYPRARLIEICRRATVPESDWGNSDTARAQRQVGECLMLLQAGCCYRIFRKGDNDNLCTDADTIWLEIEFEGFMWHEVRQIESDTFYLPTEARLEQRAGKDWY